MQALDTLPGQLNPTTSWLREVRGLQNYLLLSCHPVIFFFGCWVSVGLGLSSMSGTRHVCCANTVRSRVRHAPAISRGHLLPTLDIQNFMLLSPCLSPCCVLQSLSPDLKIHECSNGGSTIGLQEPSSELKK